MKKSYWRQATLPKFPPLAGDAHFDVVVIGAGITGLSAAYFLKRAGKKVCVVERDFLGAGDTSHTTAHLSYVTDMRLKELVRDFGEDAAQLVWKAGAASILAVEGIVRDLRARCNFERVSGYLHAAIDGEKNEASELAEEAELAHQLGFSATFEPEAPGVNLPAVRFEYQARFHPLKFLAALAMYVEGDGSKIHEETNVTEVEDKPLTVVTTQGRLTCDYVVIATHVPLMGKAGFLPATLLQTRLAPYSTYAVGAKAPRGSLPDALFWDTSDPYYYLRMHPGTKNDYIIFGGEDHKTGQVDDTAVRFDRLEGKLHSLVPEAAIDRRWSGQVIESNDGLPLIGETTAGQFIATGFAGNGMTFGVLAGLMACDAALERTNPWQKIFAVTRTNLRAGAWDYVRENVSYPYYMIADRLTPSSQESPDELQPGEGAVLNVDGQRVACSRGENGKLTMVSPVCTHMGCLVHWNDAEATWDCPCHGSRFHPTGEVLTGPAETPLEEIGAATASKHP